MNLSNEIKTWSKLYLLEILFWIFYVGLLSFAPEWFSWWPSTLTFPEAVTLAYAIYGYAMLAGWAREKFVEKYGRSRIEYEQPDLPKESVEYLLKDKAEGGSTLQATGVFFAVWFIFAWGYQFV